MSDIVGRIESADQEIMSPEKRAEYVYMLLSEKFPELTVWDLICFSANYLGYVGTHEAPYLLEPAKAICKLIYAAHYQDGGTNIDTGIRSNRDSFGDNDSKSDKERESKIDELGPIEKSDTIR